jgi:hypothetical protein
MSSSEELYRKYSPSGREVELNLDELDPKLVAAITLQERERLIKLLNDSVDDYLSEKLLFEAAIIANAIAYIKGKNK